MKKIVVVEDSIVFRSWIREAISDLGEVEVSSGADFVKTIELIKSAEIVLLDFELKQSHNGSDFLPFCEGKKVIGISGSYKFAPCNFMEKHDLEPGRKPKTLSRFRSLFGE